MTSRGTGSARRNRWTFAAAVLVLCAVPACLASPPGPKSVNTAPVPARTLPQAERGELLFEQRCASCHGPEGQGTDRAPSLAGVGDAYVHFMLSTGRMPPSGGDDRFEHQTPAFSAEDISALVAHVATFGPGGQPIPVVQPGDVRLGRSLYLDNCAACHSSTGVGGILADGRIVPSLFKATPQQVGEAVRVGPGPMPAYPSGVLTDDQLNAVASYVDVLQNEHGNLDRGGIAFGRWGPLTEGMVTWFVGMVLVVGVIRWLGSRNR